MLRPKFEPLVLSIMVVTQEVPKECGVCDVALEISPEGPSVHFIVVELALHSIHIPLCETCDGLAKRQEEKAWSAILTEAAATVNACPHCTIHFN